MNRTVRTSRLHQAVIAVFLLFNGATTGNVNEAGVKATTETVVLTDFTEPPDFDLWFSVNDVVMGGMSGGSLVQADDSVALFGGFLSLENNGGFASVRTRPVDWKLDGYTGIRLRVRGDGRRYQFRLRTDDRFDGMAYRHEFGSGDGEWLEIDLPFAEFEASFRGRIVTDAGPVEPSKIRQIGFLIADKQPGEFSLHIDRIEAYR